MQLIKEIGSRRTKKGILKKWGRFLCLICLQEIEKLLYNGLRDKSCGCIRYKLISESNKDNKYGYKHGGYGTRLYIIWDDMKQRILNPNNPRFKTYGGRGITICDEWLEFIPFRDWSLNNGYGEGLEIDRENTNGNYEPSNCRWTTSEENQRNRRNNKIENIEQANEIRWLYNTGDHTQQQLAKKYNTDQTNISYIINNKIWKNK